tara:strand:+ start:1724 stop:2569 length:846 start_codon:yes stop_codon:yes gene_type:complete
MPKTSLDLTDEEMRSTLASLVKHVGHLEKFATGLAVQLQQVHEENKELKRKYDELEQSTKESLKGCALLPAAPAWKYIEETFEGDAKVRDLTTFELECIVDGIRNMRNDDPRIKHLALITRTEPNSDGHLTFRVRDWTNYVKWCAYYCVRFQNVKKRAVQHTRHTLVEEVLDKHAALSVNVDSALLPPAVEQNASALSFCAGQDSSTVDIQKPAPCGLTREHVRYKHAQLKRDKERQRDKARLLRDTESTGVAHTTNDDFLSDGSVSPGSEGGAHDSYGGF